MRSPVGTRAGGLTSDLLVDGVTYDVYTPTTTNINRIISAVASKNSQTTGVILDLSKTSINPTQLSNIFPSLVGRTTPSRGMVSSPDIVRKQYFE